jgi:hypothetical protein
MMDALIAFITDMTPHKKAAATRQSALDADSDGHVLPSSASQNDSSQENV